MTNPTLNSAYRRTLRTLGAPIDGASLAAFRMMFGLLMVGYCIRMLRPPYLSDSYTRPALLFKYFGFDWVDRIPLTGLYGVTGILLVAAVFFTCGIYQRTAASTFFLGWTYLFLLEKAYYINHFYLVSLLMFLFAIMPANGAFTTRRAGYSSAKIPTWCLWAVRAQFGIVYFYAGLAKIHCDWLAGEPMRAFLTPYFDSSPVDPTWSHDLAAYAFSWGGLAFDLLIVPGLLWPRTRIPTLLFAAGFHLFNHALFNIGFFPWIAMAGAVLFLPPDWPRQMLRRIKPGLQIPTAVGAPPRSKRLVVALICGFFAVQLIVPFQRFLYPGNQHWTEEGQKFSWLLMMKNKVGDVEFTVLNRDTGQTERVNEKRYLNDLQILMMTGDPDLLVQFAHHLAEEARANGIAHVAVYAETAVSLNGRAKQPIVSPDLDLTTVERSWAHYAWIVPLDNDCWTGGISR